MNAVDPNTGQTTLHIAIDNHMVDMVKHLVKRGAQVGECNCCCKLLTHTHTQSKSVKKVTPNLSAWFCILCNDALEGLLWENMVSSYQGNGPNGKDCA